jgi:hypothetical protein
MDIINYAAIEKDTTNEAFKNALDAVTHLSPEERTRVLKAICVYFNIQVFKVSAS